ncbi:RNA-protein complex protein Nop10 [Methanoculleus sp. YWC-01]|uniref:Ribosome biogenesis protein Nop10 n=1 Tax=Methanoculleus nereidis TaxID=2735141 RepID=A0ABU3Z1V5_9EURY|nr:RNA-protein complex protein Nop10 [Methanoculleus sp. YWC-01]MCK9297997.1 RNA-protein complex protein Nop10 [Methanoculleus sp.]MDV4342783.1 RNA-protein complex protein Nop10 [Methanoculleus sp. YWC-01]PKL55322.1 MAG: ribosome biogenesis protein [Methanomicrobiales archaeon HGW-Methanomicrobiales-6]
MSNRIRRCPHDRRYTLSPVCPVCGRSCRPAHPARFSPEDRYGSYRRTVRRWNTSQ